MTPIRIHTDPGLLVVVSLNLRVVPARGVDRRASDGETIDSRWVPDKLCVHADITARRNVSGGRCTNHEAAAAEHVDAQGRRWCDGKAMTAVDLPLTVTRGACPHDCPDTCAWTVTAHDGLDPLPGFEPARESPAGDPRLAARFPLALVTAKGAHHFLNSSYGNVGRALRAERSPVLDLHADDADARGITDGDVVRVFNDRGSVAVPARVGDRVRRGVVALPSGWLASQSPSGLSANALTGDGLTDLGGSGVFHSTLVEVERSRSSTDSGGA
jgi:anaerobic selenocysteine-containing dehydrogenase